MPRPQRIEFADAWYHVLNTGDSDVFKKRQHYELFISVLKETVANYGLRIHAFCLLKNRYDLLVSTPYANLSTAMRNINSLFTQDMNRLTDASGAVFRGRFKSVLIEPGFAALPVSRYIHLLPQLLKITRQPQQYKWSSLSCYTNAGMQSCDFVDVKSLLSYASKSTKRFYQSYLDQGIDEQIHHFYTKKNLRSILSTNNYLSKLKTRKTAQLNRIKKISLNRIAQTTAKHFNVQTKSLSQSQRGPHGGNIPRAVSMLLARQIGHYSLKEIAEYFDIDDVSTVSITIKRLKAKFEKQPPLEKNVNALLKKMQP